MVIETNRMRIVPLDEIALETLIFDEKKFNEEYCVKYDGEKIDGKYKEILINHLSKVKDDNDNWFYYTFWMMETGGVIIGSISFVDAPKDGILEIIFGLNKKYEENGYMTEGVKSFCKFAKLLGIRKILAKTEQSNIKAQNVLKNAGFAVEKSDKTILWSKNN